MNPHALVCINAWPDPQHLPLALLKEAYASAIANLAPPDLQYSGPDAQPQLIEALLPRLARDGLMATEHDVLVVNSYIQALALTLQVAPTLVGSNELSVAVEEPGYPASFNLAESLGHRLIAVETDAHGALPTSVEAALDRGANVVVLTPRALNPTGASWTVERRAQLADVLGQFPRVLIVEDDHFSGLASGSPGSLFQDQRLAERTVHVRSFSKSLAPDLRETVVIARGRLRKLVRDAKINNGGWTSKVNQRALAAALAHPALDSALEAARSAYAQRREALIEHLLAHMPEADLSLPTDGLNIWMRLPVGCDALDVIQNAAHLGVLISSGEGFYLHAARRDAVRISIGHVTTADARRAGELVARAVLTVDDQPLPLVV
jgi:GntR family transcriptional regulator/MocR family aminotransferase